MWRLSERERGVSRRSKYAVVCGLGAGVGCAVEYVHQGAGVWSLPPGATVPWWIAPVYFCGLALTSWGFSTFERRLDRRLAPTRAQLAIECACFLTLVALPPLLHRHELWLTAVATALLAARLAWFRAPGDVALAAVVAAFDGVVELGLTSAGLFSYSHAAWGSLPLWLAPLWGGLALGLRRFFA